MRMLVQDGRVILAAETDAERALCASLMPRADHVFALNASTDRGLSFEDLGARADACREPINITRSVDPLYAAISNLAATPFLLDDEIYGSAEGFWQSLKFADAAERRRVAVLSGVAAKRAGDQAQPSPTIDYRGEQVPRGTHRHWKLMKRACAAKFDQDDRARRALLATGQRPLTHRVPRDSETLPGVIMADIWMRIRARLQSG